LACCWAEPELQQKKSSRLEYPGGCVFPDIIFFSSTEPLSFHGKLCYTSITLEATNKQRVMYLKA
jgi:hypothetical protein